MPTSYSLSQEATHLYIEACEVLDKIRTAKSGNRLDREQYLALLTRKQSILADARSIIDQVSQILDLAYNDPNARVPHDEYITLTSARTMARTIIKMAHTNLPRSSPYFQPPSPAAANSRVSFFSPIDCAIDEDLPF